MKLFDIFRRKKEPVKGKSSHRGESPEVAGDDTPNEKSYLKKKLPEIKEQAPEDIKGVSWKPPFG